jgi:hypothetical protein
MSTFLEAVKSARTERNDRVKAHLEEQAAKAAAAANGAAAAVLDPKTPVTATKAIAFKAVRSQKADELGVIELIAASSGSPDKLDLDSEFLGKADVVKMAFDFCSDEGRTFKANHKDPLECKLVESFVGVPIVKAGDETRVLKADEVLTPEMEILGVDRQKADHAYWFVTVKPQDSQVLELAKSGGIAGASWGATVTKTEV